MARFSKAVALALLAGSNAADPSDAVEKAFHDFAKRYARSYLTKEEEAARFAIFKENFAFVEAENAKGKTYKLEVNHLADQSSDEMRSRMGFQSTAAWADLPRLGTHSYSGAQLPESVDWVSKGAVTSPKNQARCGSCWAFSTTGALEGAWQIASGKLVSVSEQQLVDCSSQNHGCHGGAMDLAFTFLESTAACTEDSYAYTGQDGQCHATNCTVAIPAGSITGYKDVTSDSEQALMEAVAQQPVSIAIEADQKAFQMYKSGVLTADCGNKLDHGVLLVGYGTDNGVDYWKVKNSWGAQWGDEGYVRLQRGGSQSSDGECGLLHHPSYPVVKQASSLVVV